MTSETTAGPTELRFSIDVACPAEHAFQVFTRRFDAIKPRDHNLMANPIVETVLDPFVGGTIRDIAEDGTVCVWARILVFEPPQRLAFSWDIGPTWEVETDPAHTSEVTVTFEPTGTDSSRVVLEHTHLERHLGPLEGFRGLSGGRGWPLYLDRFRALVSGLRDDATPGR